MTHPDVDKSAHGDGFASPFPGDHQTGKTARSSVWARGVHHPGATTSTPMGMKVWIDQDLCTGDGLCEEIAPDVFTLLDDGLAYVQGRRQGVH